MYFARALIMGMEERQQLLVGLWTMMAAGEGGQQSPACRLRPLLGPRSGRELGLGPG